MKYIFEYQENNYIVGFQEVASSQYDYSGDLPDDIVTSMMYGGWYKLSSNTIMEDSVRKQELIDKHNHQSTWEEKIEAQVTYTAMMMGTLIEEEV